MQQQYWKNHKLYEISLGIYKKKKKIKNTVLRILVIFIILTVPTCYMQ
jgi:hypothetical protein